MILVAGLTPAWQQTITLERLRVGEVNRARSVHWAASGKVLNVGIAARRLGAAVSVVCAAGGQPLAPLRDQLAALDVSVAWVETAVPTRVCTTVLDAATNTVTELVENAPALSSADQNAFLGAWEAAVDRHRPSVIALAGSLPAAVPASFYHTLIAAAQGIVPEVRAVLDIRGPELLTALACRPLLVKPNREELAATVGRRLDSRAELLAAMRSLIERGATWVLVSDGPRPAVALSAEGCREFTPPAVTVVNPIGCGDCLCAGIATALAERAPIPDAIVLGLAAAAENATRPDAARLDRSRVHAFRSQVLVREVGPVP